MAGLGKKTFQQFDILTAADTNGYLMDQSVMRFASAAARDTAIPSPTEGMVCYLDDVNWLMVYTGSAWTITGGDKPYFFGNALTTVANASDVVVGISTITNRGGFINTSGVITIPISGYYSININNEWESNSTGYRISYLSATGSPLCKDSRGAVNGNVTSQSLSGTFYFSAGNTLASRIYQTSGGTRSYANYLSVTYLGS